MFHHIIENYIHIIYKDRYKSVCVTDCYCEVALMSLKITILLYYSMTVAMATTAGRV